MGRLEDVKGSLDRLAGRGWRSLLKQVTDGELDIGVPLAKLKDQLLRPLGTIRRNTAGFQEFATQGLQAVAPGAPARSLLYHAFASADVRPLRNGKPSANPDDYPTLEDLDALENFIYGCAGKALKEFNRPVLAVFAYQYRSRLFTPHRQHADLAFSRVGLGRIGTEASDYDPLTRSFDPRPAGERGFRVLPARFAAFIAEERSPTGLDSVLRPVDVDDDLPFLFPRHKLFSGKECLVAGDGAPLDLGKVMFHAYHVNEKLRRLHIEGDANPNAIPAPSGFNLNSAPFVREDAELVDLEPMGESLLVVSKPAKLVRTARQTVKGTPRLVGFDVPREKTTKNQTNRFLTSLSLNFPVDGRAAPEYANIRQEIVKTANGTKVVDLNRMPAEPAEGELGFEDKLRKGGYRTAHFIDQTCDGAIAASVKGLDLRQRCAYSLVTAVDFFPQVEQLELQEWVETISGAPIGIKEPPLQFRQGGPKPLSDGRFSRTQARTTRSHRSPNRRLPFPGPNPPQPTAFPDPGETLTVELTASAVVGSAAAGKSFDPFTATAGVSTWLPDAASDVFAPGWDISLDDRSYSAYGLGSPFAEDAKLCAALNSYWPAAAPDSARTYGNNDTSVPLLDGELGYSPDHPRVLAGEVDSNLGWDGDYGPFLFEENGGRYLNCSDENRADLTRRAFDGKVGFSGLDRVTTEELIRRMEELRFCLGILLPSAKDPVKVSPYVLATVERVQSWSAWKSKVLRRASTDLQGAGFIFVFARVADEYDALGDPPLRRRIEVRRRFEFQLAEGVVFYRENDGKYRKRTR